MTTRNMIAALGAIAAFAVAGTLHAEAYTSASYVQGGLIAQWDGIDNAGTGTHDPNATVWKDLVGNLDMTLTAKGRWNMLGNALYVSGMGAQGPRATPAYKTIEIVFKMKRDGGRVMFASGLQSRLVGVDPASGSPKTIYFNGKGSSGGNDKCFKWSLDTEALCTATATYTGDNVADVYCDGAVRDDGNHANPWNASSAVAVGGRTSGERYPWFGEIYAIRLYDTVLTAEEIAANAAIDRARFQPSESSLYVQDGLIAQWDGKDNAGRGVHDAAATAWKDLVGGLDLSLTENGSWSAGGNALVVNGPSAVGETAAPKYETIEVVYRMTKDGGRILFNSGYTSRFVLFDPASGSPKKIYLDGTIATAHTPCCSWALNTNEVCCVSGTYDGDEVSDIYFDGSQKNDGIHGNNWGASGTVVVGGRLLASQQSWYGEVYAIRLYNRRLTKAELAYNNKIDRLRFLSSKNYKGYDALLAQWDGENNFAAGVAHNPEAATWNDLKGAYDLTLSANGSWTASGNGLVANGAAAYRNSAAPAYRTFEVAYRETNNSGRFLFNSGNSGLQVALFNSNGTKAWFSALVGDHRAVNWTYNANAVRTMAATYTNSSATAEYAYGDGVKRSDGTVNDSWGSCESKIIVGDNKTSSYRPWYGEVYAIRLYNRELTDAEIAFNSALDKTRVALGAKAVAWSGVDGDFSVKANWTGGVLPRYMDNAEILSGTAVVKEEVVGSLSLGADAALSFALPADPDVVPLTILGGMTADAGAGLQLDAAAFGKKHPEESITLIVCEKDSSAALETLASNLSFVNTSSVRRGTVAVADGTRLVYTAPQKPGTKIIIR